MTDTTTCFARDYFDARLKFLRAARTRGAVLEQIEHPLRGEQGEALFADVARLGPADAKQVLVLISGVHGVELCAGSGCQVAYLDHGAPPPPDLSVVLVHAINPWGAAHLRRCTEGNVDLARNFFEQDEHRPDNPAYERIHEQLCAADHHTFKANVAAIAAELDQQALIGALMGGQYAHADGFSFGGASPVWSHRTILSILARNTVGAEKVSVVEYHSGLGPYGYGMAVSMQTGRALARTREMFGQWLVAPREQRGEAHSVPGHTTDGYSRALAGKQLASIVLEFGTYPPLQSLPVLLDDHWLHRHGDPSSEQGKITKAQNLEMHLPSDSEWTRAIADRSTQVIRQALAGFAL